jgi:drug/metabolite transporter (DMT)-like permease
MGLILLLESVLGTVWGWLGTSERPNVSTVLGGTIVLAAVAIKLREDNAHAERERASMVTVP